MNKQETTVHYKPMRFGVAGYHNVSQPVLINRPDLSSIPHVGGRVR